MSKFEEAVRAADFSDQDAVVGLARIGILAESTGPAADAPLGTSRIGGVPDLPANVAWPSWQDRPLVFIAQINLEELPQVPDRALLPESGILYFFFAITDKTNNELIMHVSDPGCLSVIHADVPTTSLKRAAQQAKADPGDGNTRRRFFTFASVGLTFRPVETLPVETDDPAVEMLPLSYDERDLLDEILSTDGVNPLVNGECPQVHQMLGHPLAANLGSVAMAICIGAASGYLKLPPEERTKKVVEWELLLQVDSQDEMCWGDCGRIYFMIRREDLLARRFERTWLHMMCS